MKSLEGKVALVTGSARGIGAAIALRLGQAVAAIAVNYSKSKAEADSVAERIGATGGRAAVIEADLSESDRARSLVERTINEFGRLDILVNNAFLTMFEPLVAIDHANLRSQFALNVEAPIFTTQAAAPHLKEGGRVVNISGQMQLYGFPGASGYAASKGAIDALTRVWAKELAPQGVTVNAVGPGPVRTDSLNAVLDETLEAMFVARTPLGRRGEPRDIADIVAFLVSPDARWLTGQVISATGGLVL